jgi:hypothetical protein
MQQVQVARRRKAEMKLTRPLAAPLRGGSAAACPQRSLSPVFNGRDRACGKGEHVWIGA